MSGYQGGPDLQWTSTATHPDHDMMCMMNGLLFKCKTVTFINNINKTNINLIKKELLPF